MTRRTVMAALAGICVSALAAMAVLRATGLDDLRMTGSPRAAAAAETGSPGPDAPAGNRSSAPAGSGAPVETGPSAPAGSGAPVEIGPSAPAGTGSPRPTGGPLPGMPPLLDPRDLYAADRPGQLAAAVRSDVPRVYVPNNLDGTVSVIDPATFRVIRTVRVARSPEHVVPSWDLRTLWVNSDQGDTLTPIDPATGRFGAPVAVNDPYNLYFTPDGRYAVVMAEADREIVFRDAHTMALVRAVPVNCAGVNHADFSADGRYFIATCEFSGDLVKVDTETQRVVGTLHLPGAHPMPQDIKISPDGTTWYVADMDAGGLWILDGDRFTAPRFLATGRGAHGLYVSRDSRRLFVTNRDEGTVSVLSFDGSRLVAKWHLPGGGSPDMGGLSADGRTLWLSGRYDGVVYAIDAADGRLLHKITVGRGPHGLCVWPQPGRYSLGHTGILR